LGKKQGQASVSADCSHPIDKKIKKKTILVILAELSILVVAIQVILAN